MSVHSRRVSRPLWLAILLLLALAALHSASNFSPISAQEPTGEIPDYPVHVKGRLLNPDGSPAASVPVRLWRCQGDLCIWSQDTTSNAEGIYEVQNYPVAGGTPRYLQFGDDTTYHASYWSQQGLPSRASEVSIDYDNLPLNLGDETVYKTTGDTNGTVRGVITVNNVPKAGIEVHLYAWTWLSPLTSDWVHVIGPVLTGADGRFSADVPKGQYKVMAKDPTGEWANHYDSSAQRFIFPGHEFEINASMVPASKITGTVRNAQGQPVAGVTVRATCGDRCEVFTVETITASNGTYTLPGLHQNSWMVSTLATEVYAPSFHGSNGEATLISVGKSITVPNIDIVAQKAASIEGKVLGNAGEELAGIEVCITGEYGYCDGDSVHTDANGKYVFSGLNPRSVVLRFEDPARNYFTRFYHNADKFDDATQITLEESKTSVLQDQTIVRGATISGRVIDLAGNPIDAAVYAYLCSGDTCESESWSFPLSDGRYRIDLLPAGKYKLKAYSMGAVPYIEQWHDNAADEASAEQLTLDVGTEITDLNFILLREDGTVPEAEGTSLAPNAPMSFDVALSGGRTLNVSAPAGAVKEEVRLRGTEVPYYDYPLPAEFKFGSVTFSIFATQGTDLKSPMTFEKPVRFTITYLDTDVEEMVEEEINVLYLDEASRSWKSEGITVVERLPAQNKVIVEVTHLTTFGLFEVPTPEATSYSIWLPRISK